MDRNRLSLFAHCTAHTSSAIAYTMDSYSSWRECLAGLLVAADAFDLGSSGVLRMQKVAGGTAAEQFANDIMQLLDRRTSKQ